MNFVFFINIQEININAQDNSSVLVNFGLNQSIGQLTTYKTNQGVGDTGGNASSMTTTNNTTAASSTL